MDFIDGMTYSGFEMVYRVETGVRNDGIKQFTRCLLKIS